MARLTADVSVTRVGAGGKPHTFEHIFALAVEDASSGLQVLAAKEDRQCESVWLRLHRFRNIKLLHLLTRRRLTLSWWLTACLRLSLSHHFLLLCLFLRYELFRCDAEFGGLFFNGLFLSGLGFGLLPHDKLLRCYAKFGCLIFYGLLLEGLKLLEGHATLLRFHLHHFENMRGNLLRHGLPWWRGAGCWTDTRHDRDYCRSSMPIM
jgi:hypothetical protein